MYSQDEHPIIFWPISDLFPQSLFALRILKAISYSILGILHGKHDDVCVHAQVCRTIEKSHYGTLKQIEPMWSFWLFYFNS